MKAEDICHCITKTCEKREEYTLIWSVRTAAKHIYMTKPLSRPDFTYALSLKLRNSASFVSVSAQDMARTAQKNLQRNAEE